MHPLRYMAPLTLTELCALIGETLDESLAGSFWVKAEISSLSERGGHMYLDLIDGKTAKMRATCWAGSPGGGKETADDFLRTFYGGE